MEAMQLRILKLIALLCVVQTAMGAVAVKRLVRDKDHPDQCLMSPFASSNSAASRVASNGLGTPEVYKVGEVVQLKDTCGVVACTDEGEYLMLHYTGCGQLAIPTGCKLVTDQTKPYPNCCPEVECPEKEDHLNKGVDHEDADNAIEKRPFVAKGYRRNDEYRGEKDPLSVYYDTNIDEASSSNDDLFHGGSRMELANWFRRERPSSFTRKRILPEY